MPPLSDIPAYAPHSQAAEGSMSHLYNQEREDPTRVLGRFQEGGCHVGDESTESPSGVQPFRVPSVIYPERRICVVVVR